MIPPDTRLRLPDPDPPREEARGIKNRGTANRGLGTRGLDNRGLDNRGTSSRGIDNRGVAPRWLAPGAVVPGSIVPAMPSLPSPVASAATVEPGVVGVQSLVRYFQNAILALTGRRAKASDPGLPWTEATRLEAEWERMVAGARKLLVAAKSTPPGLSRELTQYYASALRALRSALDQQDAAVNLVAEILPHFGKVFGVVSGKKTNLGPHFGRPVRIRVLPEAAFRNAVLRQKRFFESEDLRALLTYNARFVEGKVKNAHGGVLPPEYGGKIDKNTKLSIEDRAYVLVPFLVAAPEAFHFAKEGTVFVRETRPQDFDIDVLSDRLTHELCHAYTHPRWNEVLLQLGALLVQRPQLAVALLDLDEAITSELASVVIGSHRPSRMGGSPPPGYAGYGGDIPLYGRRFLDQVEGVSKVGLTTVEAVLGGRVALAPDVSDAIRSVLVLGGTSPVRIKVAQLMIPG